MKKLLLLITLLLSTICLHAQNLEWAPIGATWYYSNQGVRGGDPLKSYEKYVSEKDTVVQGKTCRLIKSQYNSEIMYEDSGRVYYFFQDDFHLIYDYTANVGDTINFEPKSKYAFYPNPADSSNVILKDTVYTFECAVMGIDTIVVDGKQIRSFRTIMIPYEIVFPLKDFRTTKILDTVIFWQRAYNYRERIGYEYDFLFKLCIVGLPIDCNCDLRCYHDSELEYTTGWWKRENKECDYYLSSAPTIFEKKELNITIVQDPANSTISVRCNETSLPKNLFIKIFDTFGKVIKEMAITNVDTTLNTSPMSSGIYFISFIQHNNVVKTSKIIIP